MHDDDAPGTTSSSQNKTRTGGKNQRTKSPSPGNGPDTGSDPNAAAHRLAAQIMAQKSATDASEHQGMRARLTAILDAENAESAARFAPAELAEGSGASAAETSRTETTTAAPGNIATSTTAPRARGWRIANPEEIFPGGCYLQLNMSGQRWVFEPLGTAPTPDDPPPPDPPTRPQTPSRGNGEADPGAAGQFGQGEDEYGQPEQPLPPLPPPGPRPTLRNPDHQIEPVLWRYERVADWRAVVVPEMEWIIPGWIPRKQVTGLYGVGGIQKTNFFIQLSAAVSYGGLDFLGFRPTKMPVLAFFCEDTRENIIYRLDRVAYHYGLTRKDFPDFYFISLVGYGDPEFVEFDNNRMTIKEALLSFDEMLNETKAGLAILDTAAHFFGGEEIRRRDVTRFIRQLDGVSITRNCGIMFSRHPSQRGREKGGGFDSGSTAREAGVRARLALTVPTEKKKNEDEDPAEVDKTKERVLTLLKANYGRPGSRLEMIAENGVFIGKFAQDPGPPVEKPAAPTEEPTKPTPEQRDAACDKKFIELIPRAEAQGRHVNMSKTTRTHYGPAVFAGMAGPKEGGFSEAEYTRAMIRLLNQGRIKLVQFGPPSRDKKKFTVTPNGKSMETPEGKPDGD